MNYILRNLNKLLELPKLRQVYLILVESIISYGIIGWGGAFDNAISQLEIYQNQIIRYSSIMNECILQQIYTEN